MKKNIPNIKLACIFGFILFVPFAIKTLNTKLEIFPAPIFPSGSSKFEVDVNPDLYFNVLYGIDSTTKSKKELNKYIFFKTIPVHYLNILANKDFGLNPEKNEEKINFLGIKFTKKSKVSSYDIIESKKWISRLLLEQGCIGSTLLIRRKKIRIDRDTKKIKDSIILDEATIKIF